ncbi:MAG TPA: gamma-glutamyl-gamma-aminobutyrate hydrolase family protein [Gaiellales bacterium]|nr:gamma-glutamyl-gamma-aminobutyrate hydrolase family protein [Gaiellales bacterium]
MSANGRRPVIGYTIMLADSILLETEPGLRDPLERFGALPVLLPRRTPVQDVPQLLDMIDGLLLTGGDDVHPKHYGHEPHELTKPGPDEEDAFELEIARGAFDRGMPVLGVCRGIQVMAVADGGTLTQDVETLHEGAHRHRYSWRDLALEPPGDHWHRIEAEPGSAVERWMAGGEPAVNSFHHQCVATTGARLAATARAADGVIETIERVDGEGFAAGMQWHNELMWRRDERYLRPFEDLVEAARTYAARRHPVTAG